MTAPGAVRGGKPGQPHLPGQSPHRCAKDAVAAPERQEEGGHERVPPWASGARPTFLLVVRGEDIHLARVIDRIDL